MNVTLEAIKFNHDPTGNTTGAFNIRRNEQEPIQIPEWQKGESVRSEDSPAAYALDHVKKLDFNIKAKFSVPNSSLKKLTIKAVLEDSVKGEEFDKLTAESRSAADRRLGETEETEINFKRGQSGFQTFTLNDERIWDRGVGVRDLTWRWHYSQPSTSKTWTEFAVTHHRIYTVLCRPTDPWKPGSSDESDTQVPWTDVLDYACRWAATTTNVDDGATQVTQRMIMLGHEGVLHYDNPNSGAVNFTYERPFMFDCSDFLRLLSGQKNVQGRAVNCDDCAAVVVSFANILGCNLNEGRTGGFYPRRHLRIGSAGISGGKFSHHTTAWKGRCTESDQVFDACLQLNSARDKAQSPEWFVPTNMIFGMPDQQEYRFLLASVPEKCIPRKKPRRRSIGQPKKHEISKARLLMLAKTNPLLSAAIEKRGLLMWRSTDYRLLDAKGAKFLFQSFWKHRSYDQTSLGIDAYECSSAEAAHDFMNIILKTFQLAGIRDQRTDFGDSGFANSNYYALVFRRKRFVFRFRNTGSVAVACDAFARVVDKIFI